MPVEELQQSINLLIVDDNKIDAKSVERALRRSKIMNPIHWAKDGIEALAMLRGEDDREKIPKPIIMLVDLNMPRLGGIGLIKEIRKDKELANTIVFVLSTSKRDEDIISAYGLNIAGYIVKENVGKDCQKLVDMFQSYWRLIIAPIT